MGSEHYCLRWNNHQNNLLGVFSQLLRDESLVDVTLACSEGHSIRAHKVVLSACSSYFQSLFVDHPSRHPIVILKDVRFSELRTLVDFMYKGEVNVEYCQLSALLKTAESLKVKGLAEMTRDYKPEPGHVEPTEFVARRLPAQQLPPAAHTPPQPEERDGDSPASAPAIQNLRVCKMLHEHDGEAAPSRPPSSPDNSRNVSSPPPQPPSNEHGLGGHGGLADMVMHNSSSSNAATTTTTVLPPSIGTQQICPRIDSPINNEAVPGPSTLPPVQQVPLSLKKEVDWSGGSDEKPPIGESSSDYSRHPDPDYECKSVAREDSPRLYHCMYCGISFPHQSKLTRHILSHSLETLKYRELQQSSSFCMPDPTSYMESPFSGRIPSLAHEPPDPTDQPPTPMDLELGEAAASSASGGVVLCKFCGKSFPDVSSLITHLPVHTGDRPFKCEFCGKAFKLRHHMKDHCRVHTGERPFRCALCGKTFSRSTILKAHEKTHYPKYVRKFLSPSPLDTEEESPH